MFDNSNGHQGNQFVLVSGATGYVGGRLVPCLLKAGYQVRVLVRGSIERLSDRPWATSVELVEGDALQLDSLDLPMQNIDVAFFLIQNKRSEVACGENNACAASNFAAAADRAGVRRIMYLGNLSDPNTSNSDPYQATLEIGDILRETGIPVTEFRSGLIVGAGSLSFEMVRHLVERLPIMVCPRWVFTRIQPIAVQNVLDYLVVALEVPESAGKIIDIGGADILSYAEMLHRYGIIRGLRRPIIPVPVVTPRLSSFWIHLMTPIPAEIALSVIEGMCNETLAREEPAASLFPDIKPMDYFTTVTLALRRVEDGQVETIWSDALASSQGDVPPVYLTQEQGMFIERRQQQVKASKGVVYRAFSGLGGQRGWPVNWSWRIRGAFDRLIGGVGMRRGRRHPDELRVGDALDFWRVEAAIPNEMIRLRAEMKVPGRAWLQFETRDGQNGQTDLIQTALFVPKGLSGLLYWYSFYPIHSVIFSLMVQDIGKTAERNTSPHRGVEGS